MALITDIIEPDHGCEGYADGEEPTVILITDDKRSIEVPDRLAYKKGWDIGCTISDEDIMWISRLGGAKNEKADMDNSTCAFDDNGSGSAADA